MAPFSDFPFLKQRFHPWRALGRAARTNHQAEAARWLSPTSRREVQPRRGDLKPPGKPAAQGRLERLLNQKSVSVIIADRSAAKQGRGAQVGLTSVAIWVIAGADILSSLNRRSAVTDSRLHSAFTVPGAPVPSARIRHHSLRCMAPSRLLRDKCALTHARMDASGSSPHIFGRQPFTKPLSPVWRDDVELLRRDLERQIFAKESASF